MSAEVRDKVLEIQGLFVDYGRGPGAAHALSGINLSIDRGEIVGIVGESGSGKSTLAYAITRLLRPPGEVVAGGIVYHRRDGTRLDVLGADRSTLRRWRWAELAIVFQAAMNALNPVTTLRSQLLDVFDAHRPDLSQEHRLDRAVELMSLVGIPSSRLTAYPHQLSGGMRQRAMIAMALALDPEVLIFDEPTTALDVVVQQEILTRLRDLQSRLGFSVIFITHDLGLLLEVANRIAVMYAGRVVELAPAGQLNASQSHPYSEGLLASAPSVAGPLRPLRGLPGLPPDLRSLPPGCAFHPRCYLARDLCRQQEPALIRAGGRLVACLAREHPDLWGQTPQPVREDHSKRNQPDGPLPRGASSRESAAHTVGVAGPRDKDATAAVLEGRALSKAFRVGTKALQAVDSVSLSLWPGRVVALVGESGSGKSTVAAVLAGLYKSSSGDILLRGQLVRPWQARSHRAYAREVQMVFQDPYSSLNPIHTVGYLLSRPLVNHRRVSRRHMQQELEELLTTVHLTPPRRFLSAHPHELSGGQRQRVAVARAMAPEPRVLLADEPVSMLDVSVRLGLLNLLNDLKERSQLAVLYITHDIASARYFADQIQVMYAGELIEGGPSEAVTQTPAHPYTRLLVAAVPGTSSKPSPAEGVIRQPSDRVGAPLTGCRFADRCPHVMPECRAQTIPGMDLGGGHWVRCLLYREQRVELDSPGAPAPAVG